MDPLASVSPKKPRVFVLIGFLVEPHIRIAVTFKMRKIIFSHAQRTKSGFCRPLGLWVSWLSRAAQDMLHCGGL